MHTLKKFITPVSRTTYTSKGTESGKVHKRGEWNTHCDNGCYFTYDANKRPTNWITQSGNGHDQCNWRYASNSPIYGRFKMARCTNCGCCPVCKPRGCNDKGTVKAVQKETEKKSSSDQTILKLYNESLILQRISKLEADNKTKTSQIQKLNQRILSLEDERKEFEMTINNLKEENKELKLQNINTDNWKNWNYEEICEWIVSLDSQMYGKYKQILMESLKDESVNGEALTMVDVSDIKRWGIRNFVQSKTLMKHIQTLVANKIQNNQNQQMMNEGANAPTACM